jgi:hypothetical protein
MAQLLFHLSGFDTQQLLKEAPAPLHHAGCTAVVHLLVTAHLPQAAGVAHSSTHGSGRQQQRSKA